jgi:ABC-type thiamine transport system ATPase subunit
VSLGEFGATSFLARDEHPTLPSSIYQLIGRPGSENFGMALAASVVLAGHQPRSWSSSSTGSACGRWGRSELNLAGVSVSYDGVPAVLDASLELPDGRVLAVLGPSGCGKSTLLRAVAGLEPLVAGTVAWGRRGPGPVPTHKRGFALMFQDGQLFGHLTVARNVGYALRLRRVPDADARVEDLLALVGLEGYADRLPATLSGGDATRRAGPLPRRRPRLLLLDEPLSALDTGLRSGWPPTCARSSPGAAPPR